MGCIDGLSIAMNGIFQHMHREVWHQLRVLRAGYVASHGDAQRVSAMNVDRKLQDLAVVLGGN